MKLQTAKSCHFVPDDKISSIEYATIMCKNAEQKDAIAAGTIKASDIPESELTAKVLLSIYFVGREVEEDAYGNPKAHKTFFFTPAEFEFVKAAVDKTMTALESPNEVIKRLKNQVEALEAEVKVLKSNRDESPRRGRRGHSEHSNGEE